MSSINLKELSKKTNLQDSPFTYIDLHLDIQQATLNISNTNAIKSVNRKDIEIDNDEAAIRNSIFNILNTRQGQRFLIPTFGCNLLGYIGRPITDQTGREIGRTILDAIRIWEPRVTIDDVLVIGKPSLNEYDITITVTIPSLKRRDIKLIGTLTNSGILESRLE